MALERVREFEALLHEELTHLEASRDEVDKKALDKEINDAADQLDGLKDVFRQANEAK